MTQAAPTGPRVPALGDGERRPEPERHRCGDLARVGVPAERSSGEDQLAIEGDFEAPPAARVERHLTEAVGPSVDQLTSKIERLWPEVARDTELDLDGVLGD